jgi:hypothetical protein
MLSDKYLWLVPELTLVHKVYKLALFQELVTLLQPVHKTLLCTIFQKKKTHDFSKLRALFFADSHICSFFAAWVNV